MHLGFTVSGNVKLGQWLNAAASYSIVNRSYNNIGLGFAITSPVQLYIITDNILGVFAPQNTKNVNVRVGINLVFGKKPKTWAPSIPTADPDPSIVPKY